MTPPPDPLVVPVHIGDIGGEEYVEETEWTFKHFPGQKKRLGETEVGENVATTKRKQCTQIKFIRQVKILKKWILNSIYLEG